MRRCFILILLLLGSGCATTDQPAVPRAMANAGQPMHAADFAQWRDRLYGVRDQMLERNMTQIRLDKERRRVMNEIAESAGQYGTAIDDVLARSPALKLNESEQARFQASADKLRDQAVVLQARAQENDIDLAVATMKQMAVTCNSCHTVFGKPIKADRF